MAKSKILGTDQDKFVRPGETKRSVFTRADEPATNAVRRQKLAKPEQQFLREAEKLCSESTLY